MQEWGSYTLAHMKKLKVAWFQLWIVVFLIQVIYLRLDIEEGVINGSGVSEYKQVLKENYQSQNIIIDENEYALAGSIGLIGSKNA